MQQVSEKVLQVVIRSPGCSLEDVVVGCPDLT